jgi:hypothetical protein
MLGYCGINCTSCQAYQGTVNSDRKLLEKAAGSFWNGAYQAEDWVCLGCLPAEQPFLAKFCTDCKIRSCAIEKGVQNCAACAEFDECSKLHDFIQGESQDLVQKMKWLRERFVANSA